MGFEKVLKMQASVITEYQPVLSQGSCGVLFISFICYILFPKNPFTMAGDVSRLASENRLITLFTSKMLKMFQTEPETSNGTV